jgi:nitrogen fixation NifU-like protein
MSELRDLYQEVIIDHAKRPRNFRQPSGANRTVEGYNPLCGDKVTLYLAVEDGRIVDAGFRGSGCAISTASASMLTEAVKSKSVAEARALAERFHDLVAGPEAAGASREGGEAGAELGAAAAPDALGAPSAPDLGKLAVFAGVREFPSRVKCATLVWHSLRAALTGDQAVVSTE